MSPNTPEPTAAAPRTLESLRALPRWAALGAASGVLAGLACWAFLTGLDAATDLRLDHPALLYLLPVAGLAIGWAYQRFGGRAAEGNALLLDQVHQPTAWVPRRMAPMVAVGTVASHLFGASVGREGTALQMSGSLTDALARQLGLRHEDRRVLLTAAIGGGFGAVFGVPLAGLAFGLEVQRVTWHRPSGERRSRPLLFAGFRDPAALHRVLATGAAALVGDRVVRALGHHHPRRPQLHVGIDAALLGRAALAGVAFGLAAVAFVAATDLVRAGARQLPWPPLRPAVGGALVVGAVALVGRSYLGLSLPLIDHALAGDPVGWKVPLLKLAFTALCLGSGFIGGEVTPLFVIGTTLGGALAPTLGLPPAAGAAIGFVAVFGGATNTPVACTVMAFELFGRGAVAPAGVACAVAYLCSGDRGIYPTQLRPDGWPVSARRAGERFRGRGAGRARSGPGSPSPR
ncbi:chloride channel protein [Aquihabitans sp. G128]|uniref:chloride channel protein n=1 Tax=Aquihabitans sp. G128 TaxID=2849779 RepID=UPI001C212EF1|nr:chloride channel protein [Aquihabitans sp. G128]QXC59292.1 chloride channel protein [Aquihabitans sp. G128]